MHGNVNLPVLLVAFKRPEKTRVVLESIRAARPPKVYFAVDGPRPGKPEEARLVAEVKECLSGAVDWDCEVRTLFRDENLGCARGVSEAISWFFEREEAGIILEDDCLPVPGFYRYCEELLARHADDERVMHVGGCARTDLPSLESTYFWSRYPQVWGWATWRRAWERFRLDRPALESELPVVLERFPTAKERRYWEPIVRRTFAGRIDSWAYRWAFAIWLADGLSAHPARNMVANVGFGADATHTTSLSSSRWSLPAPEEPGEIRHPHSDRIREDLDARIFEAAYAKPVLPVRLLRLARGFADARFGRAAATGP